MDNQYVVGKIYIREEFEIQKASPSFGREYDLKYLGKIGKCLLTSHDK